MATRFRICTGCSRPFPPGPRYIFACQHTFCPPCFTSIQTTASLGNYASCPCGDILARPRTSSCPHGVAFMEFRPSDLRSPNDRLWPEDMLPLPGQRVGRTCQKCQLVRHLQVLSERVRGEVKLAPFAGEVYACVEVNGYVVHGMGRRENQVDLEDDGILDREVDELVGDIAGLLAQSTMEWHFKPLGDIRLTFRARGWVTWARMNQGLLRRLMS